MKLLIFIPLIFGFTFNEVDKPQFQTLSSELKTERIYELKGDLEKIKYGCCKVCTRGCACGDSCISCSKNCIKGAGCACDG